MAVEESQTELHPLSQGGEHLPKSPSIEKWPRRSDNLKSKVVSEKAVAAFDLLLTLCPLSFLVIGIMAFRLDGQELSPYGDRLKSATTLGPTLFPIIFAAVVGRLMRSCALWRAERGAAIGLLEQLNGSTSFASTCERAFMLHRIAGVSVAILLLWAASPLGGQSILRILTTATSTLVEPGRVAFLNSNNVTSSLGGTAALGETHSAIDSLLTSSILATKRVRQSPRDAWSYPKMPLLRDLPVNGSGNDANEWRYVDHDQDISYSSLVGLVVKGVPRDQDCEFDAASSYFGLDCKLVGHDIPKNSTYEMLDDPLYHNSTNLFSGLANFPEAPTTAASSLFLDTNYNFSNTPINLWFGALSTREIGTFAAYDVVSLFNCSVSTVRVEATVMCQKGSCAVNRMRRSKQDTRPDYITPWNDMNNTKNNWVSLNNLISQFPYASGIHESGESPAIANFIYGQALPYSIQTIHDWKNVSAEDVSTRLGVLFNTYWQSSLGTFMLAGTLPSDALDTIPATPESGFNTREDFNETSASFYREVTVYRASIPWTSVTVLTSIILQVCAIVGLLIKWWTVVPDILGYVSTMTRDNPHVPLPPGGSTLDGLERARVLQGHFVQILDTSHTDNVGHIALASIKPNQVGFRRVRKNRSYI